MVYVLPIISLVVFLVSPKKASAQTIIDAEVAPPPHRRQDLSTSPLLLLLFLTLMMISMVGVAFIIHVVGMMSLSGLYASPQMKHHMNPTANNKSDYPNNEWDDKKKNVNCFSWSEGKAADEWWTHKPTYHVTSENDDGFCFSQYKNITKRTFMKQLYLNQFEGDCSRVISRSMGSSGWGFDFKHLADALWMGMVESRPVQMILTGMSGAKPGVWHYAGLKNGSKPVCKSTDMYCYMLPITNCKAKNNTKDILAARAFFGLTGYHWHADWIVEYETRMQTWLRKEVYEFYKTRIHIQTPCTAFHVRRSDIKGHGFRKYHDIRDYVNAMKDLGENKLHENILLITDDQDAIEEAVMEFPEKNWMYIDRTRFRGTEGGWENHFPSGDPKTEVVTLFSIFRAVRQCDSISMQVGSFANLLLAQMEDVHGKGNVTVANLGGTFGFFSK